MAKVAEQVLSEPPSHRQPICAASPGNREKWRAGDLQISSFRKTPSVRRLIESKRRRRRRLSRVRSLPRPPLHISSPPVLKPPDPALVACAASHLQRTGPGSLWIRHRRAPARFDSAPPSLCRPSGSQAQAGLLDWAQAFWVCTSPPGDQQKSENSSSGTDFGKLVKFGDKVQLSPRYLPVQPELTATFEGKDTLDAGVLEGGVEGCISASCGRTQKEEANLVLGWFWYREGFDTTRGVGPVFRT